jgi:hypothetical protein
MSNMLPDARTCNIQPDCDPSTNSNDEFGIPTIYPRESAPLEIGCLIRSKEDALNLHKVIRGYVQVTRGVGETECNELGNVIRDRWAARDFCRSDVEKITNLVQKLDSLYDDEDMLVEDATEYGAVRAILDTLRIGAEFLIADNSLIREQSEPASVGQREVKSGLSLLIRSRADAMLAYTDACWFATRDEQEEQYRRLKYLIEKWDTPSFTVSDARMMETIVDGLSHTEISDHLIEYEGPEFGYAKGLLEALAEAAQRRVMTDQELSGQEKA